MKISTKGRYALRLMLDLAQYSNENEYVSIKKVSQRQDISEKYLDTLEQNSVWREPQNFAYLKQILENETPMEIWEFSHEDVLAVQKWVTNEGNGDWKIGQEANQEFLHKFAYCKK